MSRGCALWMSESKCQRSRSQYSDYWKWFLAHNCFPFTSAIIKLHAQIPCEPRISLTDIGVKNLGSLNWLPRGVFVTLGQSHSSLLQNRRSLNYIEVKNYFCQLLKFNRLVLNLSQFYFPLVIRCAIIHHRFKIKCNLTVILEYWTS